MASRGSYSPRKIGTIIDMAHIIIGAIVMIMACFAIFRPAKYMFLFPMIFFMASILSVVNSWFLFATYQRNSKKKAAGVMYGLIAILLFALFVISAISIWLHG